MSDFTSVLYLGMTHARDDLPRWSSLTTGRPAALVETRAAGRLAAGLAELAGHEAAALGTSTLHLFCDLFAGFARDTTVIHVADGTYPIARWGVDQARARGVPVMPFAPRDRATLAANLSGAASKGRPVVVTDGLCPLTGRPAPLDDHARACRDVGGLLVVDDTQGLGLFGRNPCLAAPYGADGAGTPAWCGALGPDVLVVTSLAKGFGAPLAAIMGSATEIDRFLARSLTRVHCSPPSMAAVGAGAHALVLNANEGPARRGRLLHLIRLFRRGLARLGWSAHGGIFPLQTLRSLHGDAAVALHRRLLQAGVRTVLHRAGARGQAHLSFALTCLHKPDDIARALDALARCGAPGTSLRAA